MITLNSISHTYPGESEAALRDVSLTLGDATVTALVGPNGSGKTTLMQILGGLLPPSSGNVSLCGTEVSSNDLLGYSIVVSSDRDFDNSSASAMVAYAALRTTWDQKLFDRYVQRFSFQLKGRKTLSKMSSGQAAILAGAVALASGAPITVLDEIQAPWMFPPDTRSTRNCSPWPPTVWRDVARGASSLCPHTWSPSLKMLPRMLSPSKMGVCLPMRALMSSLRASVRLPVTPPTWNASWSIVPILPSSLLARLGPHERSLWTYVAVVSLTMRLHPTL